MNSSTLLLIFGIGFIIYFSIGIKKRYYDYKYEPGYSSINSFTSSVAGIVLGIIFLILYFLGYPIIETSNY